MRANLDAAGGLPLAEHVAAELAPAVGRLAAHDLVAAAAARAAEQGVSLPEALLADPGRGAGAPGCRDRAGRPGRSGGPGRLPRRVGGVRPARAGGTRRPGRRHPTPSICRKDPVPVNDEERAAAGLRTRREVLGDEHVDRAVAATTTDFTADFQDFITRYAWGEVWNRPGLSRPERSMITLAMLAALGRDEEFALHVKAGIRNGLDPGRHPGGTAAGGRVRGRAGREPRLRDRRTGDGEVFVVRTAVHWAAVADIVSIKAARRTGRTWRDRDASRRDRGHGA